MTINKDNTYTSTYHYVEVCNSSISLPRVMPYLSVLHENQLKLKVQGCTLAYSFVGERGERECR